MDIRTVANMFNFAAVADFINSVGFPIAMVAVMGYILYKEQMSHKEESDRFVEAINNNTTALAELKLMVSDFKETLLEYGRRIKDLEEKDDV